MVYKNALEKVLENRKKEIEESIQNNPYYDPGYIAMLCGYIGDKRFIAPLEKILKRKKDNKGVLEALVRIKAEPYYTDYVSERTRSIEDIKEYSPHFSLNDLVYVLGDQNAYLELSKYLLSSVDGSCDVIDSRDTTFYNCIPIYIDAMFRISRDIRNPSLQKIVNAPNFDRENKKDCLKVYKWMRKNYGKYEIFKRW
jgi:hypothetical protein